MYFLLFLFSIYMIPFTIWYIRKYRITPVSIFLLMEMNFFYGICFAPKGQEPIAVKLELLYVVACFFYTLGVLFSIKLKGKNLSYSNNQINKQISEYYINKDPNKNQTYIIWIIIIVSVILCAYFFIAGGMNVFLQSLKDFFSSTTNDYSNDREKYFGIAGTGYIYQFRVILLPLLATFLALGYAKKKSKLITIPLFILMIIFLLGTGQRNAFVFYCLIVVIFVYIMSSQYKIQIFKKWHIVLLSIVGIIFMVALTIGNGRVEETDNMFLGAIGSIFERLFSTNQKTAITAFGYIETQPTVWGYDWWMMLMDILPGKSGYLSVDRIVYFIAYGTYNGTGPPCLWGSAWYNFYIFGVSIFPFLLGWAYHSIYKRLIGKPNKTRLYILIYSAICVYLGIWTYGTPMTLFNNGVVTVFILLWLVNLFESKNRIIYQYNIVNNDSKKIACGGSK